MSYFVQTKPILLDHTSTRIVEDAFDPKCCSEQLCSVFERMQKSIFNLGNLSKRNISDQVKMNLKFFIQK